MGILGLHDAAALGRERFEASHAGGYAAADGIRLISIADVDAEHRQRFGDAWDIPPDRRYPAHETRLSEESPDVVSVCTPTLYHRQHLCDAVRIADPSVIWCEKPIAASVADAEAMIATCADAGTELVINHSFRFCPKHRQLRDLIRDADLLGTVHAVTAQFRMELLRNATHVLDTIHYLLGTDPQNVSGYLTGQHEAADTLESTGHITDVGGGGFVVYDSGTFARVDCTVPRAPSAMSYQFVGAAGRLRLDNDIGEWHYWRHEDGTHVPTPLPGLNGTWSWEQDYAAAFPNAAGHLVSLLDGDATNRSPGDAMATALAIIIGLFISHYTGGRVTFPLAAPHKTVEIRSW